MDYDPLDTDRNEFRLLHLNPALRDEDELSCYFTVALLDKTADFEALSYVWGAVDDTLPLNIGRRPHGIITTIQAIFQCLGLRPFGLQKQITRNLHSALRHLRLKDKERVLWVDALCINQSDNLERGHRVSRMSSIYGQASRVVVWLSEGWDGSDLAMDFLEQLGQDADLHLDPSRIPYVTVSGLTLESSELREHLIRIFAVAWWKRTWTVQEFVLARDLVFQCNKRLLSRELMYYARENFWKHKDRCCDGIPLGQRHPAFGLSVSAGFIKPARLDYIIKTRSNCSVLAAVATFSTQEATDRRDRIYGMLGLGTGQYASLIEPDYDLSAEQICETLAVSSAERTGTLEFLSHLFTEFNPNLPSFVPNWTGSYEWLDDYEMWLNTLSMFNASLDTLAYFKMVAPGKAVTRGVIFDTISETGAVSGFNSNREMLETLRNLASGSYSAEELYCHTNESNKVAFWHTLCGGVENILDNANRFSRRAGEWTDISRYEKWEAWITSGVQTLNTEVAFVHQSVLATITGRRFIKTQKGYIGWASEKCEEGDLVVVLAGGKVPYILHSEPEVEILGYGGGSFPCYSVLGDSYVHGIMDGEVFQLLDESDREMKDIILI
jgi:hypothetical protein